MRILRLCGTLFIVLGSSIIGIAQDIIVLKNGVEITGKIIEIQPDIVNFQPLNSSDGTLVAQAKSDIFMIKYASGLKEVFGNEKSVKQREEKVKLSTGNQNSAPKVPINVIFTVAGFRSYFGISPLGLAIPLGNFGNSDPNNPQAGGAIAGYNAALEFGILPHPNFGIGGNIGLGLNGVDVSTVNNQLKMSKPTYNWSFDQGNWSSFSFMAGPIGSIPFKNSSLDVKILVGAVLVTSPTFGYSYTPTSYRISVSQSAFTSASFAWMPGINYRIYLSPYWGIKCNLDFLFSQPLNFEPDIIATSPGYASTKSIYSFSTSVSLANIGIGVFLNFGN